MAFGWLYIVAIFEPFQPCICLIFSEMQTRRPALLPRFQCFDAESVSIFFALDVFHLTIPSLEVIPNATPATLPIQMTVLDEVAEVLFERVSTDSGQFHHVAYGDASVLAGKFNDL